MWLVIALRLAILVTVIACQYGYSDDDDELMLNVLRCHETY